MLSTDFSRISRSAPKVHRRGTEQAVVQATESSWQF
jgi:hypothetical protein